MNRLLSTISLTKRAGKLLLGFDQVKDAVLKGEAEIVLTASDLSEKSRKGINLICEAEDIESFSLPITMDEFWYEIGKRTGIIAVTDPGLAGKLRTMLSRETEE
ncbi:ribosomal L7Ae/L30e/S12e/Gadd45 family protein [Hydrogenoanaerobacterium sp.]|uniref:L7Ae/L30e/S12e/Gadd45 family ribosomal protein n=1 Tax=Hydrogenoanaerobacterium sp. TaxID=2953763 RepID=UPI0028A193E7|nr:ribosomal L7Ae/L30e/S12e/Gadd45 family protein [Hydrogenoanaerobacterium sp.]